MSGWKNGCTEAPPTIVAVGNGYKQAILKRVPKLNNISVITNGVDLENFSPMPPDEDFRQKWGLEDKFVCAYAGTIGMAHGLEVVLDAADTLKKQGRNDICFLLVGDGARRKELQNQAEQRKLQSHVVFTGRLPKSDMGVVLASSQVLLIHLKACDLFTTVIPSKMFEAMAMQRPIIMGVDGEASEIVAAGQSGIDMEPGNTEQLIEAVCRLADDPEFAASLASQGRPFVAEHYTRDVLASRFLQIMRSVAARQPVASDDFNESKKAPE